MHFLIFIPGQNGGADLAHVGLSSLEEGAFRRDNAPGPNNDRGMQIGWASGGVSPTFYKDGDDVTWLPAQPFCDLPAGRYFVGIWNHSPPTPDDLRRPQFHGGRNVALGDGQTWQVPNCCDLPHAYVLEDGYLRLKPKRGLESVVARAIAWDIRFREPGATLPTVEVFEYAIEALSLNHRMTREVASHLQLFTDGPDSTLRTCFAHCIGAGGEA